MKSPNTLTGLITASATAVVLAGCSSETAPEAGQSQQTHQTDEHQTDINCHIDTDGADGSADVVTYLPTWGPDAQFKAVAKVSGIDQVNISFAVPDRNGDISLDLGSDSARGALQALGRHATGGVSLAVGGWGASPKNHKNILQGFAHGTEYPDEFAGNICQSAKSVEEDTGVKVSGVDLDWEYPNFAQAEQLPALVRSLQDRGFQEVSVAVPAAYNAEPVQRAARELARMGVIFNVMTYDLHGPWEQKAGTITDRNWLMDSVSSWVDAAGSESAVRVGLPTYGYPYFGAEKGGDTYDVQATNDYVNNVGPIETKDIDPQSIVSDPETMTSSAIVKVDGKSAWTSIATPEDAQHIMQIVRNKYPDIGGAFTWEARGMDPNYVAALKSAE